MKNYSVLIVDDDETDRYLLKRQLKQTNLDLTIFEKENGQDAYDFFDNYSENKEKYPEAFPPLIVFLDINMPLLNGFEFLEKFSVLKNKGDLESTVVLMFTSSEREEDRNKVLKYNFVKGYLLKGEFDIEMLRNKIEGIS